MTTSRRRSGTIPVWVCAWCGGAAEDEESLLDHQEWCLGDVAATPGSSPKSPTRDGELTQEALVAEAKNTRAITAAPLGDGSAEG